MLMVALFLSAHGYLRLKFLNPILNQNSFDPIGHSLCFKRKQLNKKPY